MLAKGFVLSKDALKRARSLDKRHQLLSNATSTVASLDRHIGLSEKISMGTAIVSGKVREVDKLFQVSGITNSALAAAEQKASIASPAIMSNRYMSTGASWVSTLQGMVTKAAGDVSSMTMEKAEKTEEERKESYCRDGRGMVRDFAELHLYGAFPGEPATAAVEMVNEQTFPDYMK